MRKMKRTKMILLFLVAVVLAHMLLARENRAPFDEIEFLQDHPGAGDRHVVFTPVLQSDHLKIVGQPVGADFGVLHFRDCDGDGVNEAVIETDAGFWDDASYRASVRHVYRYGTDASGSPRVKLIASEYMPEKDPDWIRGRIALKSVKRYCES